MKLSLLPADPIWLRHRRRLLHSLLVAMLVLFSANAVYRWTADHTYRIPWLAYGVPVTCLLLNRLGRPGLAATIAVLLIPVFIAVSSLASTSSGANLPSVRLDPGQLQQVVVNLCLNSRDAMPQGGRLILETELVDVPQSFVVDHPWATVGLYVAMVVADSGTGMTPETEQRIFEPFFTTKETLGGTGLGLAVVHGIVEQHRGFIRVDTQFNEGTSFRVYFPVSGEGVLPRPVGEEAAPVGGTETILVAEDADAIRTLIERTLGGAGYRVITAANGKEAVKLFQ